MSSNAHTYDDAHNGVTHDDATESGPSAARLLEMTARETDRWRAEAKEEAESVVAEARVEATSIVTEARSEAARMVREARIESERLREEAEKQAAETMNDARVDAYRVREEASGLRKKHEDEIAALRQVATEHKEQLRRHLAEMMERVEATPAAEDK